MEAILDEQKTGMDAFEELSRLAEQQQEPQPVNDGSVEQEIDEAFPYQSQPIILPIGWEFTNWRQRHVMALYEAGVITNQYPNRWRMNYEIVKAAIEAGCFASPVKVETAVLDDMHIHDVEMLRVAVINNYTNLVLTPKN